jgi:hypothetical protein
MQILPVSHGLRNKEIYKALGTTRCKQTIGDLHKLGSIAEYIVFLLQT